MRKLNFLSGAILAASLHLGGCSELLFNVSSPSGSASSNDVLKSLRCELVSFFAINYQNALSFEDAAKRGSLAEAIYNYPYLDIDRWQYAGIGIDLKDVNSIGASTDITRKSLSAAPSGHYRSINFGPSLGLTSTYSRTQLFTIPQYAGIGPALSGKDSTTQIYAFQKEADEPFFCYKPLPKPSSSTRNDRLADLQDLVDHKFPQNERFRRIMVGGQVSLARWLQDVGVEMARNRFSTVPTTENLFPGQLSYTFSLEIKPEIDVGYTLVATAISPFNPTATASIDATSTFSIYLNTKNAKLAIGSRSGAAELDDATKAAISQMP